MKVLDFAFVCYAVSDLKKSRAFYETALKLTCTQAWVSPDGATGFIEYDLGPNTLALGCGSDNFVPGKGRNVTAALEVDDFDAAIAHLKSQGVTFKLAPTDTPVCRMALIDDPDANPLLIHQRKKS